MTSSSQLQRVLLVVIQRRTYQNAVYLATRFPLGLLYFLVLCFLAAVGFSLLWVLVGIPILALTLAVAWGFASFERDLARWWLGAEIPPMSLPSPPGLTAWRRLTGHLKASVTWKSLVYVVLQLPAGLAVFVIEAALLASALALTLSPLVYLADALSYRPGDSRFSGTLLFLTGSGSGFEPAGLLAALVMGGAGLLLFLTSLHAVNAAARGWAGAARQMLGLSESELRLAEARLQAAAEQQRADRADQSRRQLITNVSHELRTPLASIQAHVDSLVAPEGPSPAPEDARRYLNVIAKETERLSSLVDDLLVVAGAESGGLRLFVGAVAVTEVVDHVHGVVAPIARRERSVTVVKSLPQPDLPQVMADRDRLIQVLMNLVRNAVAYTPEGGIVSIEAVPAAGGRVAIMVSDTGVGIPAQDLEHVFERFYRTDASRARSTGGFGLGLSIARELMEAMRGTITAESEPGSGSRFTVWLTAYPERAA
jgi:two-component system, OmpR family, phosphate regulon sensor histidine kinase PhoR